MGLDALGFDPGPADGTFRPATRAALKAWQAKNGMAPTGWLTASAARALKVAAANAELPRQGGRTLLHAAARRGAADMAKALIDAGAKVEASNRGGYRPAPSASRRAVRRFRTRDLLVRQRTQTINALRGHLAEFGIVAPQGPVHVERLASALEDPDLDLPDAVRDLAGLLLNQIAGA